MSTIPRALLLAPDPSARVVLLSDLEQDGIPVDVVSDATAADALLQARSYAAVLVGAECADPNAARLLGELSRRADRPALIFLAMVGEAAPSGELAGVPFDKVVTSSASGVAALIRAGRPSDPAASEEGPGTRAAPRPTQEMAALGIAAAAGIAAAGFAAAGMPVAGLGAAGLAAVAVGGVALRHRTAGETPPRSDRASSPEPSGSEPAACPPRAEPTPATAPCESQPTAPGLPQAQPASADATVRHELSGAAGLAGPARTPPTLPSEPPAPDGPCRPGLTPDGPSPSGHRAAVAVRLADPARGREIAGRLTAAGLAATAVDTTDELHALLNRDRIDLLVIEERLPGFLSGLDVIEMFHKELLRPRVLLLADAAPPGGRAAALQPAGLLLTTSGTDEIVQAAGTLIARGEDVAFIVPAARRLVAGCGQLRPMPQLIVKLAGYLAADTVEVSIPDLARDVSADPAAAAELLRVTNSAALGLRRRVAGVADAVNLLGPRKTISLIICGAAVASANELLKAWSEPLRTWYYRRGVLTAAAAQAFAKLEGVSPDTAFLLGLLQDLGVAALADAAGERYAKAVDRSRSIPQLTLPLVERVEWGFTHADVSAALLQRWGLPGSLITPVLAHHGDDAHLSKTERAFVRAMRIGEAVADLADHACPQRRQALNKLLADYPAAAQAACGDAVKEAVARALEASRLFSLSEPDPDTLRRLEDGLRTAGDEATRDEATRDEVPGDQAA